MLHYKTPFNKTPFNVRNSPVKALLRIVVVAGLIVPVGARDVALTATGRATAANAAKAREIALADALRQAVRQGIGTRVTSLTGTRDFAAEYDLVFTRAFGFVRRYEIVSQGYGDDGIYRVTVKANVSDTDEFTSQQDILALLIKRKQSPRVAIQTELDGVDSTVDVRGALRELALAHQLHVKDLDTANSAAGRRAERDRLTGSKRLAGGRRAETSLPYDVLIRAKIKVSPKGRTKVYGVELNRFGVAAELSAIWADTGETIAEISPPATTLTTDVAGAAGAVDCVTRYLQGKVPDTRKASAGDLLRKIIVRWMTELDLGRKVEVELTGVTRAEFDQLTHVLRGTAGIGQVYQREFDAKLISTLALESRLDTSQLSDVIKAVLPRHQLDQRTSGYILMVPVESSTISGIRRIFPGSGSSKLDKTGSPWRWPLIVGGIIAVVGGLILLRKPKKAA